MKKKNTLQLRKRSSKFSSYNDVVSAMTEVEIAEGELIAGFYEENGEDHAVLGLGGVSGATKTFFADSMHKLDADFIDDTNTTNKFVTNAQIEVWNNKQDAPTEMGTQGQVLTLDAQGNPVWTTVSPSGTMDTEMSDLSTNPVQNKVIKEYVDSLGIFDISSYHATGGVLAKYADLTAALGTNGANIPEAIRKGGMSVKFVQSSDNKYVQYRLMATAWSTIVTDWQGVDAVPTAGSNNLVKSGGICKEVNQLCQDLGIYYGKNVDILTPAVVYNRVLNGDGAWNTSMNASCKIYSLENLQALTVTNIPSGTNNTDIAFFKDLNLTGSRPVYATGYSKQINLPGEQTIDIPSDCKYIYIFLSILGLDKTPKEVYVTTPNTGLTPLKTENKSNIIAAINEVNDNIPDVTDIEQSISELKQDIGITEQTTRNIVNDPVHYDLALGPYGSTYRWGTGKTSTVVDIRTYKPTKITVVKGSDPFVEIGFLNSFDDIQADKSAHFCQGTSMIHITTTQEEYNIPSDCVGIYILYAVGEYSRKPKSVGITIPAHGLNDLHTEDKSNIIAAINEVCGNLDELNEDVSELSKVALPADFYRGMMFKKSFSEEISLNEEGDIITHDATLQYYAAGNKIYIVMCANQHDGGDSGEFSDYAFVRLTIFSVNNDKTVGQKLNTITVAKSGDVVGNTTILGGCGVPNCFLVGSILHIILSCKLADGIWRELHYAYDCSTDTLGSADICTLGGVEMTGSKLAEYDTNLASDFNQQISLNASFGNYGKYYYGCILSGNRIKKGIIVRTTDFVNYTFLNIPNVTVSLDSYFEGAVGCDENNLWIILRQGGNAFGYSPIVLIKMKLNGEILFTKRLYCKTSSRPQIFKFGFGYNTNYIIIPTLGRNGAEIYRVEHGETAFERVAVIVTDNVGGSYLEITPTDFVSSLPANALQYFCHSIKRTPSSNYEVCIGTCNALPLTDDEIYRNYMLTRLL